MSVELIILNVNVGMMSDIDTDALRGTARRIRNHDDVDPKLAASLIVQAADEIDNLRRQCKRNLCPNWDSDEGECAD